MELIRKGKVKEVYDTGDGKLLFKFTDNISVFDKIIPTQIPDKGESLCRTSAYWFGLCNKLGIASDFLEMKSGNTMSVRKVDVISDYSKLNESTRNFLIPLEVICRYYVAGSFHDRIKSGKIDFKALGFKSQPEYGEVIPEPLVEFTTKLEPVDRPLSDEEALLISGLTKAEFETLKETTLKIDESINQGVESRGLIHVDGKKEFAMGPERELMVIDTFGTADEDRFWEKKDYDNGNFVELSKEYVRQYYRDTGYHGQLSDARKNKKEEPPIPPLPADMTKKVSQLYIGIFERLTGEKFR